MLLSGFESLGFRAGTAIICTFGPYFLLSLAVTMEGKIGRFFINIRTLSFYPSSLTSPSARKRYYLLFGGAIESRLVFSKNFTCFNILLTCILSGGCYIWNYVYTDDDASIAIAYNFDIFLVAVVLSLVPTILFMHMPSWSDDCGGFGYCNIHNDVHMYDAVTGVAR